MGSILKIDNLSYKDILKDVSLSLEENSFNILIGANGAGKTTLVKAIASLIKYDGNICFLNNIICDQTIKDLRKDMGIYLPLYLSNEDTVIDTIMYPLNNLNYKEKKAKKIAYDISKKLDIDNLMFKKLNELTLSQKKIVYFASSVVHNPKLIVIDENFDELDNYYRTKILNYLKSIKKGTILFVTNNASDFLLADNLIFMSDGKIIKTGVTNDIVKDDKVFVKCNTKMPFLADLSNKLKLYNIVDDLILDFNEMVDEIWK